MLGGFGRSFQILDRRDIADVFAPENPLIVNTGLLTDTSVMTGLRTYFSTYNPLQGQPGRPSAIWSAGSGKFDSKLKWTGLDELTFEGQASEPVYCAMRGTDDGPQIEPKPAKALLELGTHEKIMHLQADHADAHFAVIDPAGEHWQCSTLRRSRKSTSAGRQSA